MIETLADRIRKAREEAGLTQAQLAVAAHCSRRSIEKYEQGERLPTSSNLYWLAIALGKPMSYFFEGIEAA